MSVTWNGSDITGPVLIYHDEILVEDTGPFTIGDPSRNGSLVCRHSSEAQVGWHTPNGSWVHGPSQLNNFDFKQIRTGDDVTPSMSRLSLNREGIGHNDSFANGLWSCRLNGQYSGAISVGIYGRGTAT